MIWFLLLGALVTYGLYLGWWIHHFETTWGPDNATVVVGVFWALLPAIIWPIALPIGLLGYLLLFILNKVRPT